MKEILSVVGLVLAVILAVVALACTTLLLNRSGGGYQPRKDPAPFPKPPQGGTGAVNPMWCESKRKPPAPAPGSHDGIALGCTCPVLDNNHGNGTEIAGMRSYRITAGCPLHGLFFETALAKPKRKGQTP